jgi:hypothetical protein
LASSTVAAAMDTIPTTTAALSAGSGAPNPFVRVNIVSGQTYPKSVDRIDCAGATCTYAEEMTNFANWYVYYKSRLQMMKTSVGIAFSPITANYKVGYVKLSNAGAGSAMDLKPADFTGSARSTWYTTLYNTTTSGSTPIRTAMDNVGRMFANLSPYNYAAGQEVVQYPCQPNFMILTTDGYWNGSSTANVVNNDNVENAARFCTISSGCVDPRSQSQPSIADVALHWYNGGSSTGTVSLRPALEPDMTKPGSVPAASGENTHLHMNTYTLGLGVDGVMTYEPNYDTAPKAGGDFYNLITRADRLPVERRRRLRVAGPGHHQHRQHGAGACRRPVACGHQRPRQVLQRPGPEGRGERPARGAVEYAGAHRRRRRRHLDAEHHADRQRYFLGHLHHGALVRRTDRPQDRHHHRRRAQDADLEHQQHGRQAIATRRSR